MHNSDKHARVIRASATIIKKEKGNKKRKRNISTRARESLQLRIRLPFKRERHNSKYHIWWIIRASIFTDACRREQCICSETLMYLLLCVQRWRSQTCVVCVVLHRTSIKGIAIIFRSYGYSWKPVCGYRNTLNARHVSVILLLMKYFLCLSWRYSVIRLFNDTINVIFQHDHRSEMAKTEIRFKIAIWCIIILNENWIDTQAAWVAATTLFKW